MPPPPFKESVDDDLVRSYIIKDCKELTSIFNLVLVIVVFLSTRKKPSIVPILRKDDVVNYDILHVTVLT
ncbi:hypothetical protein Trydic_g12058 [Trypoxylus dichotomus]